jgi:DNA-binding transcriptional LysR family regulator
MEMRHLRCLVAVAEELHFGRAARRLNLSQPPVSLAIKELEQELGVRLFERSSRQIALTREGEVVLRDARAVLARTASLRQHAQDAGRGMGGTLALGFISLATYSYLPSLVERFTRDFPDVRLGLHESTTDEILAALENASIDVGCLFASPGLPSGLRYEATSREALVIALPEQHPMARLTRIPLERLANERFLAFERHFGPMMFDTVVSACMRHGFSPRIFPARQMHTIVSLVAGGLGVALVPHSVQVFQRAGVVFRPLRGDRITVETGVAWRASDDAPLVTEFLRTVPRLRPAAKILLPASDLA